jgi:predicted unusual protein kinase regulating ubiquinone biosynthesis (AarF/ABC1/UbiB family)
VNLEPASEERLRAPFDDQGDIRDLEVARAVDEAVVRWRASITAKTQAPINGAAHTSTDPKIAAIESLLRTPLGREWIDAPDAFPQSARAGAGEDAPGVVAPLPRRKISGTDDEEMQGMPAMAKAPHFEAGAVRTMRRLIIWMIAATKFLAWGLFDRIRRKDSVERRAVRLRRLLEGMGPTFVKLGQQLSIRADFLPYAYCEELAKMLDRQKPFPVEEAMKIIERTTGKPVTETYAIFDAEPIGSASIACVYQAVLPSGEFVAVKVRRPGIGTAFAADLRALDWLLSLGEMLTIIRPGMTQNLRLDLKTMLLEELNYVLEARYTELFARRAKERRQAQIYAPKVYFELSGEEVIVTEFVSGVFLGEVLSALDRGDEEAIAGIKARGIDPVELAKRMTRAFNWETLEGLLFHADPHPANVIVRPGNELVFIDFGSCGRFSSKMRRLWIRIQNATEEEDVAAMVESAVSFLEPLPPIDLDPFTKELEALFWEWLCAKKSEHAEWWERCTGFVLLRIIGLARRYNVPLSIDILRLFRATFLYDSIAMRLWNGLDLTHEYVEYSKERGRRRKARVRRRFKRLIEKGPNDKEYLQIEALNRLGGQITNRIQHILDNPTHRFTDIISKAAFGVAMTLKVLTLGAGAHLAAALVISVVRAASGQPASLGEILTEIVSSTPYQIGIAAVMLIVVRKSLMRLEDIDVKK